MEMATFADSDAHAAAAAICSGEKNRTQICNVGNDLSKNIAETSVRVADRTERAAYGEGKDGEDGTGAAGAAPGP